MTTKIITEGDTLLVEVLAEVPGVELTKPFTPGDCARLLSALDGALGTDTLDAYLNRREQAMRTVAPGDAASRFEIGDRLLRGEALPPNEQFRPETLRRWKWVAERVPKEVRRESQSFQAHELVARLPRNEQRRWLKRADDAGWSSKELARQLRASKSAARGDRKR